MSELTFEQMLEESLKTIHAGEVVEGTVIDVKPEEIILNIGYKSDGILTKNEYTNDSSVDLTTVAKVGDTMEVKVLKVNDGEGQVLLTYKRLAADRGNKRIEEAFNNHEVLKATVSQVLDGGLSVIVDEVRIFIPASLVSDTYEKDLTKYAGQEIEFVISEYNPKRRRYIGDRKQLIVAKKAELQKELFEKIKEGDIVEGVVKNVTDFGAFIDLGGADGLLHISEMSWGRVEHPKKVFKVGDKLKVLIKEINGNKIALSLKFDDANPWKNAAEKYAVGNVVTGKVARMTDFGAFVELEPGVDALLHVSQISREHVEKPSDALKIGQEITAKVVDFNEEDAQKVIDYLNGGGKALIVGCYAYNDELTNFNKILAAYNVSFKTGVVAENDSSKYYQNPLYLLPTVETTDYTSDATDGYVFLAGSCAISYPEDTDDVTYTKLLSTSDSAVLKKDWKNITTSKAEDADENGPFTTGLAVNDSSTGASIVVFGTPYVVDDSYDNAVSGNNADMFKDVISSMTGNVELASSVIPVKDYTLSNITINTLQAVITGLIIMIAVPILLIIIGIVVWAMRRKK